MFIWKKHLANLTCLLLVLPLLRPPLLCRPHWRSFCSRSLCQQETTTTLVNPWLWPLSWPLTFSGMISNVWFCWFCSFLTELQCHRLIHLARPNSCLEAHPALSCRALHVSPLRLVLLGCRAGPMTCWYLLSLFFLASLPGALLFVSLGSDFWTEGEKSLFSAALEMHGKEFSLIHKMVQNSLSFIHF